MNIPCCQLIFGGIGIYWCQVLFTPSVGFMSLLTSLSSIQICCVSFPTALLFPLASFPYRHSCPALPICMYKPVISACWEMAQAKDYNCTELNSSLWRRNPVQLTSCFAIWNQQTHVAKLVSKYYSYNSLHVFIFPAFPLVTLPCTGQLPNEWTFAQCFTFHFRVSLSICYTVHHSYAIQHNAKSPFLLLSRSWYGLD